MIEPNVQLDANLAELVPDQRKHRGIANALTRVRFPANASRGRVGGPAGLEAYWLARYLAGRDGVLFDVFVVLSVSCLTDDTAVTRDGRWPARVSASL